MRTQRADSKPTNVLPALLRARWPGSSLSALRLRADHKTMCQAGAQPPGTQWQKFAVPHRKEIAAPCRLPVAGSGRSIRPIARAAPGRSGAYGRPLSREDRGTRVRREIFPGHIVSEYMEAV